jgi:glycogen synthase
MKLLMTADTVGGVWTYAVELCAALAGHGVEVALATFGAALRPHQRSDLHALPTVELHESGFALEWMDDPWEDVDRGSAWLLDLEARLRPDLIHLNDYARGVLPWRAPALVVGHSCVLSWWRAVRGEEAPSRWSRYRAAVTAGLRAADAVVAPTHALLRSLEQDYGPFAPARVIPNGRDAGRFHCAPKQDFILGVGRLWDEGKNVAALADIAPALPWPVRMAGPLEHPDGGGAAFPGVEPLGFLSAAELATCYARAPVCVLPARYEPFGLAALEAALSGCALVLGDLPSLREVWGDAALFVPPEDRSALGEAVLGLIRAPERRRELARPARQRALVFTPERMAGEYLELYRSLIERGRRGPERAAAASTGAQ